MKIIDIHLYPKRNKRQQFHHPKNNYTMKKYLFFPIALLLILAGCCKKKDDPANCVIDKSADLKNWAKYGQYCWDTMAQKVFYSKADFYQNGTCFPTNIPFPLDFNGLVLAQTAPISIAGNSYKDSVSIKKNDCTKEIDFKYFVEIFGNRGSINGVRSVAVAVDSVPQDYTVKFSYEVTPP